MAYEKVMIAIGVFMVLAIIIVLIVGAVKMASSSSSDEIDCVVSDWGQCSKECGGGTRTRMIITQPSKNGKVCPNLSEKCNTQPCNSVDETNINGNIVGNMDCVVSDWGQCSKECGGGVKTRTIVTHPAGSGKVCPNLSESCNTQECNKWSPWGDCSVSCGGGVRKRTCLEGNCVGDKEQKCNEIPCDNIYYDINGWKRAPNKFMMKDRIGSVKIMPLTQCGRECEANANCRGFVYSFPYKYNTAEQKASNGTCALHNNVNWTYVTDSDNYSIYYKEPQTVKT